MLRYLPFLLSGHFTDSSKAMVDKIARILAQIKAVAPKYVNSHCILYHALKIFRKAQFHLRMSLMKQ